VFELESLLEHSDELFDSMRKGCALYSASFSIFKDYVLRKPDVANTHPPIILREKVYDSLFADHLVADTVTSMSLQTATNCAQELCNKWEQMEAKNEYGEDKDNLV
jgi:hypothetical protein